jgi:6-phosphogluconate dehydrogenase
LIHEGSQGLAHHWPPNEGQIAMELGLVGLGKMGGNMRTRLRNGGHTVVGYDQNPDVSDSTSLADMVNKLPSPKVVWVMVPAGAITDGVVTELSNLLGEGDLIVDGGNSRWTEDIRHAEVLATKQIGFVDCGVSGGVWGLENGYALMAGGAAEDIAKVQPVFDTLKPEGDFGWVHAGKVGAGHFSKMVHNGIEYAIMQSYAEGWELLETVDMVENVTEVFRSWREGTVIRSWLLDLLVAALDEKPNLEGIRGYADDSGEGRWTVEAGIENAVATPAITAALYARFVSRQDDSPAMKAIAAMRNQFGGHAIHSEPDAS